MSLTYVLSSTNFLFDLENLISLRFLPCRITMALNSVKPYLRKYVISKLKLVSQYIKTPCGIDDFPDSFNKSGMSSDSRL